MGGSCLQLPYWPELEPSAEWALYQSCSAKGKTNTGCGTPAEVQAMRSRAEASTKAVYAGYSLADRLQNLTADEGTFRGVEWFGGLHSAYRVAVEEGDTPLLDAVVEMARRIAGQYYDFVGAEPGKEWHILPLMIDPTTVQETSRGESAILKVPISNERAQIY